MRSGSVAVIYQTLQLIQDILTVNPRATHKKIFEMIQPDLFHYYEAIISKAKSVEEAFETIFRGPYFDEIIDLKSVMVDPDLSLADFLDMNQYNENALSFIKDRTLTPLEAMGEFLATIDFSEVPYQVQSQALDIICHVPHRDFVLVGCQAFSDRHLQLVLDTSPGLSSLALIRCPNVSNLGLRLIHYRPLSVSQITISDCLRISADALKMLSRNPRISVLDASRSLRSRLSSLFILSSSPPPLRVSPSLLSSTSACLMSRAITGRVSESDHASPQSKKFGSSQPSLHLSKISRDISRQARRSSAPSPGPSMSSSPSTSNSSLSSRRRKRLSEKRKRLTHTSSGASSRSISAAPALPTQHEGGESLPGAMSLPASPSLRDTPARRSTADSMDVRSPLLFLSPFLSPLSLSSSITSIYLSVSACVCCRSCNHA